MTETETETEWRAEEYEAHMGKRFWAVTAMIDGERANIATGLDKPIAHLIAAAREMQKALDEFLGEPCNSYTDDDPDNFVEIITTAGKMNRFFAALAKSRGQQ